MYEYLILNSNPWFSAVSDYSLQMCLYLEKNGKTFLYGAHMGHTEMDKKCKEHNLPFVHVPIHVQNAWTIFKALFFISCFLFKNRASLKYIVAFEGREHTLLVITKILFPFLWNGKTLMRVRGQAQTVNSNFISKLIYNKLTDKIIFAAHCVKERMGFEIPECKTKIQLYGKDFKHQQKALNEYVFKASFPPLNLKSLTFLLLGRFDPIKGHHFLVQSYLKAKFKTQVNLVFIGKSENLKSQDMFETYSHMFHSEAQPVSIHVENMYFLGSADKTIYIVDEKFSDLHSLMQNVHFGVIPSLDSEVICRVGVEFLQCGVPVLYSNVGALPEVFCDSPEFMFEKNNVDELALKLEMASDIFNDKSKFDLLKKQAQTIGLQKYSGDIYKSLFKDPL